MIRLPQCIDKEEVPKGLFISDFDLVLPKMRCNKYLNHVKDLEIEQRLTETRKFLTGAEFDFVLY